MEKSTDKSLDELVVADENEVVSGQAVSHDYVVRCCTAIKIYERNLVMRLLRAVRYEDRKSFNKAFDGVADSVKTVSSSFSVKRFKPNDLKGTTMPVVRELIKDGLAEFLLDEIRIHCGGLRETEVVADEYLKMLGVETGMSKDDLYDRAMSEMERCEYASIHGWMEGKLKVYVESGITDGKFMLNV